MNETNEAFLYQLVMPDGISYCNAKEFKQRFVIDRFETPRVREG